MNVFCFSFVFFRQNRFQNAKKKIESLDNDVHCQKKKARAQMATQVKKRKVIEETVDELYNWINELHAELFVAK